MDDGIEEEAVPYDIPEDEYDLSVDNAALADALDEPTLLGGLIRWLTT